MSNHIYSKKKHPTKFNLTAICNYVYMLFLVWIFVQTTLINTPLKQDRKEEGRSKAKKIIVQGNLNSNFAFLF